MKKYFVLIISLFTIFLSTAQTKQPDVSTPKLVVGIVVDQMRYDFIYRYWNKFGNDGFKRLVNEGFFCKNTNYNYVPTYTGPGHASIYTGTTPSVHGIIGNNWYNKQLGKKIYCTDDIDVQGIGCEAGKGKMSPELMLSTTIGDQLRLSSNMNSKVVSISIKDRGAIFPGGHTGWAYWYDSETGNFITSTHYLQQLPKWVDDFNKKEQVKKYLSQPWNTLLPIEQYTESIPDDNKYEGLLGAEAKPVFPHNLPEIMKQKGLDLIRYTPFGNTLTKDLAIEALKGENLGKGKFTDMLAISFSPPDYIGHHYGPNSVEAQDIYLRLDKDIAELLKFLDTHIGRNNLLLFLTADHAAVEVPEYLKDNKIPSGYFNVGHALGSLKYFYANTYGDSLVVNYMNQQVYLNDKKIEEKKLNKEEILNKGAEYLMKFEGVAGTIASSALKINYFSGGNNHLIQNGFYVKRSGDIILNFEPGWIEYGKTGTTHGSPYSYDTHVPLIFYGGMIKPGNSADHVNITDIAPTVTSLLNISFPNGCTGKPIPFIAK